MKPQPLDLNPDKIKKWVKEDLLVPELTWIEGTNRAVDLTINKIRRQIKSACGFYLQEITKKAYDKSFGKDVSDVVPVVSAVVKLDDVESVFKLAFKDVFKKEEK